MEKAKLEVTFCGRREQNYCQPIGGREINFEDLEKQEDYEVSYFLKDEDGFITECSGSGGLDEFIEMLVDNFTLVRTDPQDWRLWFSRVLLKRELFEDSQEVKYRNFLVEQCKKRMKRKYKHVVPLLKEQYQNMLR